MLSHCFRDLRLLAFVAVGAVATAACVGDPPQLPSITVMTGQADRLFEEFTDSLQQSAFELDNTEVLNPNDMFVRTSYFSKDDAAARLTELQPSGTLDFSVSGLAQENLRSLTDLLCGHLLQFVPSISKVDFNNFNSSALGPKCSNVAEAVEASQQVENL